MSNVSFAIYILIMLTMVILNALSIDIIIIFVSDVGNNRTEVKKQILKTIKKTIILYFFSCFVLIAISLFDKEYTKPESLYIVFILSIITFITRLIIVLFQYFKDKEIKLIRS